MSESSLQPDAPPSSRSANGVPRWIGSIGFIAMAVMLAIFFTGQGPWLLGLIPFFLVAALLTCVCGLVLLFRRDWTAGLLLSVPAGLLLLATVWLFSGGIPWLGYSGYG
jgi:hypothetical protein